MEAARTSLRTKKGPVRRRRRPSGCAVRYRMGPDDDPPRLVVTVVMYTGQTLRMQILWIVSPDSSTTAQYENSDGCCGSDHRSCSMGGTAADPSILASVPGQLPPTAKECQGDWHPTALSFDNHAAIDVACSPLWRRAPMGSHKSQNIA